MSTAESSSASTNRATTDDLDRDLAEDIDQLAEGDFESVDEVFDGAYQDEPLPINTHEGEQQSDRETSDQHQPRSGESDFGGTDGAAPVESEAFVEKGGAEPSTDDGYTIKGGPDTSVDDGLVMKGKEHGPDDGGHVIEGGLDESGDDGHVMQGEAPVEEESVNQPDPEAQDEPPPLSQHATETEVSSSHTSATSGDEGSASEELDASSNQDVAEPVVAAAETPAAPTGDQPAAELESPTATAPTRFEGAIQQFAKLWAVITPHLRPVVLALAVLPALPLRHLPEPWRPMVDWVAISLVFWVPIVWVLAFLMTG